MTFPLKVDGNTVWDANGRVIISALNPLTPHERKELVELANSSRRYKQALERIAAVDVASHAMSSDDVAFRAVEIARAGLEGETK